MTIVRYKNRHDIDIQFEDGSVVCNKDYCNFKNGAIKHLNHPSYLGKGYLGYGKYKSRDIKTHDHTKEYIVWGSMLTRCYSEKYQKLFPSYVGCTVCDEWLNFQNFAEWFNQNYYEIPDETMELDKDILSNSNKIYSPDTCCFIPSYINCILCDRAGDRGDDPRGVVYHQGKYEATACVNKQQKYLGSYDSAEEAFNVYKTVKEQEIKRVAELYKDYLPNKVYERLCNYRVIDTQRI